MKSLILSAGYGTRLLPYTRKVPKPLFTLNRRTVIEITIDKLVNAGCDTIVINTHHLHNRIEAFLKTCRHSDRITAVYEPEILETGGAIKNAAEYLKEEPFVVINSDILFSLDISGLVDFHLKNGASATLALHKDDRFNTVTLDNEGFIKGFSGGPDSFAFTGIQVLSPEIFDHMPAKAKFSSIELYEKIIREGGSVKAYLAPRFYWEDIGTLAAYRRAAIQYLSGRVFGIDEDDFQAVNITEIAGDGSDRRWYRAFYEGACLIAADHGINDSGKTGQADAFVRIGDHLYKRGVSVPKILNHDLFAGIAIVQDLGDTRFDEVINACGNDDSILDHYTRVCDALLDFNISGCKGFCSEWTFETAEYSREMILEKECRYFMDAYINGYLNLNVSFDSLLEEFEFIAGKAVDSGFTGLMHRDMQSKNIMIHNSNVFFIDFQSARKGPVEYDLASLVIDPYVNLPDHIQQQVAEYFFKALHQRTEASKERFEQCFIHCRITRNLQILGAFSHLSRVKGKHWFAGYIPGALRQLKKGIDSAETGKVPELTKLVKNLQEAE
ncbi:MAG: sugar phosphate nucleotidyltransferase [Thermodesulfobacteriota bacterium]